MKTATNPTDVKICKRCQYYKQPLFTALEYAECWAPETMRVNMVTGESKPRYCDLSRKTGDVDGCGISARYYQEKL